MTDTRIDEKAKAIGNLQNTEEVFQARDAFLREPTGGNWRAVLEAIYDEMIAAREEAGFVEVPREPTDAMMDAGVDERNSQDEDFEGWDTREIYRAMIAKAT